jgi:hypothetical protein
MVVLRMLVHPDADQRADVAIALAGFGGRRREQVSDGPDRSL